jgi:hypothetical protein
MQVVQGDFTYRLQAFAVEQLEQIVFSYLPLEVIDLESPRVKNRPLKAFFDIAYFFLMLVRVLQKIQKASSVARSEKKLDVVESLSSEESESPRFEQIQVR